MKKNLLLLLALPVLFSSCYRYGYLKQEHMEGFNDTSVRQAQFYLDRNIKIHGRFNTEQNIVKDGKVTIVDSKKKNNIKVKKFTYGKVVDWKPNVLTLTFGSDINLKFVPEVCAGGNVYRLQTDNIKETGSKGKCISTVDFNQHSLEVRFNARKHAFRGGKFSNKPALLFEKKVKKSHEKIKKTAEGAKVN